MQVLPKCRCLALRCLALLLGLQLHFSTFARFSATPLSEVLRDPLNQRAKEELETIGARNVRFLQNRWYFDAASSFDVRRLQAVRHVQSIRSIVLVANVSRQEGDHLGHFIAKSEWNSTLKDLSIFMPSSNWSCRVTARKSARKRWPNGMQELELALVERFGWHMATPGCLADVTVHLQVFQSQLLLEVALLKQRRPVLGGGWPHKGLGHVEAWAMARTLDLQPGQVVLDPMCGKGSLLAEVATWWPHSHLIGVDVNATQLQRCRENFQWLQRQVSLHLANVTEVARLSSILGMEQVDHVLMAPPWNQQFKIPGDMQAFFERMFHEILRVIKPNGKVVILGSKGEVEKKILQALQHLQACPDHGRWQVVARQRFALTPKRNAVILLIQAANSQEVPNRAARHLPWDNWRSPLAPVPRWRLQRAEHFPPLIPANWGDAEVAQKTPVTSRMSEGHAALQNTWQRLKRWLEQRAGQYQTKRMAAMQQSDGMTIQ